MIVGDHVGDDGFLVRLVDVDVLGVEQFGQAEFLFSHVEGVVQIEHGVRFGQFVVLNQFWTMFVDDGVESQTVAPRRGKVTNVDILIASRLHLTPQEQGVFSRTRFMVVRLFNCDVLNLQDKDKVTQPSMWGRV